MVKVAKIKHNDLARDSSDIPNKVRKKVLRQARKQIIFFNDLERIKEKNELIQELMCKKKQVLKLSGGSSNKKEVKSLVEEEKNILFSNKREVKSKRGKISQAKKRKTENGVAFPVIPKHKADNLFSLLKSKKTPSNYERKLKECFTHLHSSKLIPFNYPSVITRAIKDAILRRKWENVTELLLLLLGSSSAFTSDYTFKPYIRYVCLLLDKFHPVIQEKGLQNRFKMIMCQSKMTPNMHQTCALYDSLDGRDKNVILCV